MNNKATIVVPIYKDTFTNHEMISLEQGLKIFKGCFFSFILPEKLQNNEKIRNVLAIVPDGFIQLVYFKDKYFGSIMGYNQLMVTAEFYNAFLKFEYLLIYQLDAFVFRNDLDKFIAMNFDYIGAPWFEGQEKATANSKMLEIAGNGGFSLRKTASFIKVLECSDYRVESINAILDRYSTYSLINKLIRIPKIIFDYLVNNKVRSIGNKKFLLEDIFWAKFAPQIIKGFSVAPPKTAIEFSFDVNPRKLYESSGNRLPFGCHAWPKYDIDFWRPFITSEGYVL